MLPPYYLKYFGEKAVKMSDSDSEVQPTVSGYSRKRQKNVEQWQRVATKTKRNKGEAYVTARTKQPVAARTVGQSCACGCFNALGMDKVKVIFEKFWAMGDFNQQNAYIAKVVTSEDVKRCRIKDRPSRVLRRNKYTVIYDNNVHTVCPKAFFSIHGISEKRVRTALAKQTVTGTVSPDRRGTVTPAPMKISDERKKTVHDHINSFPKVSSHYSRAKSPHRKYLPTGLNINIMYTLYQDWMLENHQGIEVVSSRYYRDVFNRDFNIGFEPPKSDTCNYCDKVNIEMRGLSAESDNDRLNDLKTQKNEHLDHAKIAHNLLKSYKDNNDPSLAVICVDLQQALPTPKLTTGVQYYKRKLWTFNFGVHNIKTGRAVMYMWNEAGGKRGSAEIASCVMHYVDGNIDSSVNKLIIFSDNCGGQNKNINVVLACLQKIHQGRFTTIEHIFMIPGHSYLPCDRDFGNIEKKIKHVEVYSQDHYATLIRSARTTRPFTVFQMDRSRFLDFAVLQNMITKRPTTGVSFKDAKSFYFTDTFKEGYAINPSYDSTTRVQVKLQKGRSKTYSQNTFDLSKTVLPEKYSIPVKLKPEKLKDIQDLLTYVPHHHKKFLSDIIAHQANVGVAAADDDEDAPDNDLLDY